ncbi:hypothetical protein QTP70_018899, partial [Hemibagrus guttatus]
MVCLRLPDRRVTTEITEMRKHAVDFYSALYTAENCDSDCTAQLLYGLPQMDAESTAALDCDITLEELTTAIPVGSMEGVFFLEDAGTAYTAAGIWLLEEALLNNSLLQSRLLSSASLCSCLRTARCMKLGHLVGIDQAALVERTGIRSHQTLGQLRAEIWRSLPAEHQEFLNGTPAIVQWREGDHYDYTCRQCYCGGVERGGE